MKAEYAISKEISPGDWRKMNLIMDAYPEETPEHLMDRVSNTVDAWFEQKFTSSEKGNSLLPEATLEKKTSEDARIEALIQDMEKCEKLDGPEGIDSFRKMAETDPNPMVLGVFHMVRSKIVQKETQEILNKSKS